MAKRLEPEITLLLMNQYAIMCALKSIAVTDVVHGQVVPILAYQMSETEKAIKHNAIRNDPDVGQR
jgi:hypothetical protein